MRRRRVDLLVYIHFAALLGATVLLMATLGMGVAIVAGSRDPMYYGKWFKMEAVVMGILFLLQCAYSASARDMPKPLTRWEHARYLIVFAGSFIIGAVTYIKMDDVQIYSKGVSLVGPAIQLSLILWAHGILGILGKRRETA